MLWAKQVAAVVVGQAGERLDRVEVPAVLGHQLLDGQVQPHGPLVDHVLLGHGAEELPDARLQGGQLGSARSAGPCGSVRSCRASRCRRRTSSSTGWGRPRRRSGPCRGRRTCRSSTMLSQLLHVGGPAEAGDAAHVGRVVGRAVDELVRDAHLQQGPVHAPARRRAASPASRDASRSARPCRSWRSRGSPRSGGPPRPRCPRRARRRRSGRRPSSSSSAARASCLRGHAPCRARPARGRDRRSACFDRATSASSMNGWPMGSCSPSL